MCLYPWRPESQPIGATEPPVDETREALKELLESLEYIEKVHGRTIVGYAVHSKRMKRARKILGISS